MTARTPKSHAELSARSAAHARALADVIRDGITRSEPHAGLAGAGAFAGSFDWHSCVHAHWALLSIARHLGDDELRAFVYPRLSADALIRERRFLDAHPGFELPYGRAWLLLLLAEIERHGPLATEPARAWRRALTGELSAWLHAARFPEHEAGDDAASAQPRLEGAHPSWLMALFLFALASEHRTPERAAAGALCRGRVEPARALARAHVHAPRDFIDLPALVESARAVALAAAPDLAAVGSPDEVGARHGHEHGRAAMRLWPLAIAAAAGDPGAAARHDDGLARLLARGDRWRDDFRQVAHWVPQFAWMAMWLAARRS